jgi:hypothetical protein
MHYGDYFPQSSEEEPLAAMIHEHFEYIIHQYWSQGPPAYTEELEEGEYWYRSRKTGKELYLELGESCTSEVTAIYKALFSPHSAAFSGLRAHLNGEVLESIPWQPYMQAPFQAPHHFRTIDVQQLVFKETIRTGQDLVEVPGCGVFVHKYMKPLDSTENYQTVLNNYEKLRGSPHVVQLHAIVRSGGQNRGFILAALPGKRLDAVPLSITEKWNYTHVLLELLLDFDSRGFFPTHLRPGALIADPGDGSLVMIDLNTTNFWGGFWRDIGERRGLGNPSFLPLEGVFCGRDSLFTIGRNLLALWLDKSIFASDFEYAAEKRKNMDSIPGLIWEIVDECLLEEGSTFESYKQFHDACFPRVHEVIRCME